MWMAEKNSRIREGKKISLNTFVHAVVVHCAASALHDFKLSSILNSSLSTTLVYFPPCISPPLFFFFFDFFAMAILFCFLRKKFSFFGSIVSCGGRRASEQYSLVVYVQGQPATAPPSRECQQLYRNLLPNIHFLLLLLLLIIPHNFPTAAKLGWSGRTKITEFQPHHTEPKLLLLFCRSFFLFRQTNKHPPKLSVGMSVALGRPIMAQFFPIIFESISS